MKAVRHRPRKVPTGRQDSPGIGVREDVVLGSPAFAKYWCRFVSLTMSALGLFNLWLGITYPASPTTAIRHTFFVVASMWMLPPILIMMLGWDFMYPWMIRINKKSLPKFDDEGHTRLLVIVFGASLLFSFFVTYEDYSEVVWHIVSPSLR